jgi:hypothetical protein
MRRTTLLRLLAGALACLAAPLASGERIVDFAAGAAYDDNLTRAQPASDVRGDAAATFASAWGEFFAPTGGDGIELSLYARGAAWFRYSGLDDLEAGGHARLRHKFGVGADAPWIALDLAASYDDFRDRLRDSGRFAAAIEAGQRLSPSIEVSAGATFDRRRDPHGTSIVPGIPGTVFDLRGTGGFARIGWTPSDAVEVGAALAVRRGDVESTAQQSLPIFLASTAIAEDPVFGDDDLYAYRIRGTTWSVALSGSLALDSRSSLNLGLTAERTYGGYGIKYDDRVVTLYYRYNP